MSQERVSGFPDKGADLREVGELPGKSGELPGKSGQLPGKSGELPEKLWIAVKFHNERELPGKSPGEVRGTCGEVPGLSRSSGEPDSLPVTRQIGLQKLSLKVPEDYPSK